MNPKQTHFRWIIVGLLFTITLVNYIDRASISYAINNIAEEFHLNPKQVGLVLGIFGIGYFITTFLGGIFVDRYGSKKILSIAIFFWGMASFLTGFASSFFTLLLARVLLGLAEGPNFPALTQAVNHWLSNKERNRALSLTLISVPVSLAIGGPIVSELITVFSWRVMYLILGLFALLWIVIWWRLFADHPEQSTHVGPEERAYLKKNTPKPSLHGPKKINFKFLFSNKTLLANNWAFFVFGYYLFFFMTWLPSYLKQQYHLDLREIGLYSIAPWLLAAIFMFGLSAWSDYIFKKTSSLRLSRSYPILISQLLSAICIVPILLANNVLSAMIFISLAVGFAMSANSSYFAVTIDQGQDQAGTASGIMDTVFAFAGFIAPTLTGYLISLTGHFEAAFYLLALLALSSTIIMTIFHNK